MPGGDNVNAEPLWTSLAERDVLCPACGYNLRGLREPLCPECGVRIALPAAADPAHEMAEMKRLALARGLRCRHCRAPLAELDGNRCAGCGATYFLAGGPAVGAVFAPARDRTMFWLIAAAMAGFVVSMLRAAGLMDAILVTWRDVAGLAAGLVPFGVVLAWSRIRSPWTAIEVRLAVLGIAAAAMALGLLL